MQVWHGFVHFLGIDYGVAYGHWIWYNMWSGVGGSFLIGMLAYFFLYYIHHTCQDHPTCFRWGKFPMAGGMFKVCGKHNPDFEGKRPTREVIHKLHAEHKKRL